MTDKPAFSVSKMDILLFNPCKSDSIAAIDELMAGNEFVDVNYIINVNIPDDHKLWLILRPELIPIETLEKIKTAFLLLIPDDHEHYQYALDVPYWGIPAKVMRVLQPQSNDDTATQLLNIVRGYL